MSLAIAHVAVTNWSSAPDDEIVYWTEAVRAELPAFCKAWGLRVPGMQFYDRNAEFRLSEAVMVSVVDDDGMADTGGYHTVIAGVPTFLSEYRMGSVTFSHEVFELLANPMLSRWAQAPDGSRWPIEVCDACQGDEYAVPVTLYGLTRDVALSNWLRPSFFGMYNHDSKITPHDRMGICPPWALRPGGYTLREASDGSTGFVWGSLNTALEIQPSNRSCALEEMAWQGRQLKRRMLKGGCK